MRNEGRGRYRTINRLCRWFQSRVKEHTDQFDLSLSTELLILDDLGTELDRDIARVVLQEVVNARQDRRMLTIVTANITPAEFSEHYDPRTWSRLLQIGRVVEVGGEDLRKKKPARPARKAS